jgi:hypothetical protein
MPIVYDAQSAIRSSTTTLHVFSGRNNSSAKSTTQSKFRQTVKWTDELTDRQKDEWPDRQRNRHTKEQTDRKTDYLGSLINNVSLNRQKDK